MIDFLFVFLELSVLVAGGYMAWLAVGPGPE